MIMHISWFNCYRLRQDINIYTPLVSRPGPEQRMLRVSRSARTAARKGDPVTCLPSYKILML